MSPVSYIPLLFASTITIDPGRFVALVVPPQAVFAGLHTAGVPVKEQNLNTLVPLATVASRAVPTVGGPAPMTTAPTLKVTAVVTLAVTVFLLQIPVARQVLRPSSCMLD